MGKEIETLARFVADTKLAEIPTEVQRSVVV